MQCRFTLDELPPELRKIVVSHMYAACKSMTVRELCELRLVNVRMAQAFYKRCMMLTMHGRYQDFFFPIRYTQGVPPCPPFEFHRYYPDPATMPPYGGRLLTGSWLPASPLYEWSKRTGSVSTLVLISQGITSTMSFGPMPQHEIDAHMADHKLEICKNLYPQEVRLFGIRERPRRRPKAMDSVHIGLIGTAHKYPWQ